MASKQRLRRRQCTRKAAYTPEQAIGRARGLRAQGKFINAYACSWCGSWHLGHPSRAQRYAISQRSMAKSEAA